MADPAGLTAVTPLVVRFADTDAQGVVYFANYLTYFDEALAGWFAQAGLPWDGLTALGIDMVYVDASSQYRRGATYGETLDVAVSVERFGRTSATWRCVATGSADGQVCAEGRLISVFVDTATRRPVPVPTPLRAAGPASPAPVP